MNNFKKVLSLGLVLVMVVATMMIVPLTTSAVDPVDGLEGDGTEANPFQISSLGHINLLKAQADTGVWANQEVYVVLTKNISVSGAMFTTNNYGSTGDPASCVYWRIDGNGYKMSGLSQPLMQGTAGNVIIRNLTLDSSINSPMATQGSFIGYANAVNGPILIENCTLLGITKANRSGSNQWERGCAGFIGAAAGSETVTIRNCVNKADINGNGWVGAFIGVCEGSAEKIIENCANLGAVRGRYAGGFIGEVHENSSIPVIKNSYVDDTMATIGLTDLATIPDGMDTQFGAFVGYSWKNISMENCFTASTLPVANFKYDNNRVITSGCFFGAEVENPANVASIAAIKTAAHAHSFADACATKCATTGCNFSREGGHLMDGPCDEICDRCGKATGSEGHKFDNACDGTCNVEGCGYVNEDADHVYTNPCDATCNVCNETRTVGGHYYEDDADKDCNFCGFTRTVESDGADDATDGGDNTTAAPTDDTTTAPADEQHDKGCGGSLNSTYAVIALVAVLGFAFVAKKREQN